MREYWLDPPIHKTPICPICFEECETIYKDIDGNVFACNKCVIIEDAYDAEEADDENREAEYGDYIFEKERDERSING